MAAYVNTNNAFSTLAGAISATDTSFTLAVGSSFPIVQGGDWSFVTFQDTANNIEIMKVTAHGDGTDSFACVRGQENTTPRAWLVGDFVECRFTAGTVVTLDGIQTLTNKTFVSPLLRFADGTLSAPGITWSNEPTTGFTRIGTNTMAVSINAQNVQQWQPSAVRFNVPIYFPNSGQIQFNNNAGTPWETMHASSDNRLHIGRIGWIETRIYGGGANNLTVHAGGVSFAGNVTGITAAMIGLGSVQNREQIYSLRPGAQKMYIGWNGNAEFQVDGTYYGTTWPINIHGSSTSCTGNAATASNATNSNQVCGVGGWRYANASNGPTWLWASDGSTQDQFLCHRASMSVNYANSANYANTAGNANALGGQGPSSFMRSNDGSVTNLRAWQDGNESIWMEVATQGNWSAVPANNTFSYAVRLFSHGGMADDLLQALQAKVVALEAKVAALEAR